MEIAKVIGIGLIGGILAAAVRKTNPELGIQVSVAAGVIVFALSLGIWRRQWILLKTSPMSITHSIREH